MNRICNLNKLCSLVVIYNFEGQNFYKINYANYYTQSSKEINSNFGTYYIQGIL